MANKVKFETQSNGVWKEWKNVAVPIKYGTLLDEQLDFATINLVRVRKKEFKPLTRARLTITSESKYGNKQSGVIEYFIADDNFHEAPVGSGVYNHEITLIELTKLLECFPLETLCFTNPNGNDYEKAAVEPLWETEIEDLGYTAGENYPSRIEGLPLNIKTLAPITTPAPIGTVYSLQELKEGLSSDSYYYIGSFEDRYAIKVENKDGVSYFRINTDGTITGNKTFEIKEGENRITYHFSFYQSYGDTSLIKPLSIREMSSFVVYGVSKNRYPLKPWTIDDVIQRVLQLVEPLRRDEKPRFSFTAPTGEKARLFSQIAPEFTFTRQTLREALQTIGGFIHAEPRLNIDYKGNYFITYDYYGEQEYAEYKNYKSNAVKRLNEYKYRTLQSKYGIEQACTKLDSYQDNLVNRIAWEEATIGQPYQTGQQTLRTETAYIRGEEQDSFYFPTTHNIDRIVKFEYNYNGTFYNITPYIFEKNVYTYLSSYDENYPNSKSYALYYTNGEKGIKGFFYKVPSELGGGVGKQYSIVNIIKRVCGVTLDDKHYADAIFRLTYVPIYNTRVQQSKAYINEYLPLPRILNYTQSDNSVESRYFGENIKGAISRMGNVEKTYTLNLRNFDNIPKAGQLWDDDYYIASVSVSVNADLFEVSVGLSKNFNRKSQFIGASSYKRIYEVSETMVQQRHTVYTDYVVFTSDDDEEKLKVDAGSLFLQQDGFNAILSNFNNKGKDKNVVAVYAYGSGKNRSTTTQEKVLLPVIASAFGNAIEFTWEYKDNFSAGVKMEESSPNTEGITGWFGKEVSYTDYYGRLYYYYFSLHTSEQVKEYLGDNSQYKLPEVFSDNQYKGMAGSVELVERKDSRETLKKSYVIEFVTDDNNFVIGSGLATQNPLIRNTSKRPRLYILPYRVNKFDTVIDFDSYEIVAATDFTEDMQNVIIDTGPTSISLYEEFMCISTPKRKAKASGKSWVWAIPAYDEEIGPVEDEEGHVSTITTKKGGDILIARNGNFEKGDMIGYFRAYVVHDIYKYLEAKANKLKE